MDDNKSKEFLVKTRIDESVAGEIGRACDAGRGEIHQRLREMANAVYSQVEEVRRDAKFLSDHRDAAGKLLGEDLIEEIREELEEIRSDLEWADGDQGKLVIAMNRYVEQFYAEFRGDARFEDVVIGAHVAELAIKVQGKVKAAEHLDSLKALVGRYPAPYPLLWQVDVA